MPKEIKASPLHNTWGFISSEEHLHVISTTDPPLPLPSSMYSSQYKSIILEVTETFRIDELFSNLIIILQVFSPICSLTGLNLKKKKNQ